MVVRGLSSVPVIAAALAVGACSSAANTGFPEDDGGASSSSGSGSTSSSSSGSGTQSGSSSGSSSGSGSGSSSGSVSSSSSGSSSGSGSGSSSGSRSGSSSGSTSSSSSGGGTASCGCHGAPGCAVWDNVYVSWYGFNDNSCETEGQTGCNDIAYEAPVPTSGMYGTPYPNANNIVDTEATEHSGTYDDPITAASSADTDPQNPTAANPRHKFETSGGATLSPGTIIYNPEVQKYFILEDSCIECGDEYACIISPEDSTDCSIPSGCVPGTNLHIDFWMGPQYATDSNDLTNCENNSTVGNPFMGVSQVVVNPPPDLPVVTTPLFTGSGAGGGCWTSSQVPSITCQ
jgi:hypothetical protein